MSPHARPTGLSATAWQRPVFSGVSVSRRSAAKPFTPHGVPREGLQPPPNLPPPVTASSELLCQPQDAAGVRAIDVVRGYLPLLDSVLTRKHQQKLPTLGLAVSQIPGESPSSGFPGCRHAPRAFCSLRRAPSRHLTELGVVGTTESAAQ